MASTAADDVLFDGQGWPARIWVIGVLLVAALALGATLELASELNGLWVSFPGALGLGGVIVAVAAIGAAVAGLFAVWRLSMPIALMIAAAVLVTTRAAAALLVDPELVRDPAVYDALARGILDGRCCFGEKPHGYPVAIAAAYWAGLGGEAVNLAAGLIGGLFTWALGRQLAGPRVAAVALYLYAVWPAHILLTGVLLSETVYATLLLGAVWGTVGGYPTAGALLLGVSHYVRSFGIFLAPAFLGYLILRRSWRSAALFVVVLVLALLPVVVATGGVTTNRLGGWSLLVGTNQEANGRFNEEDQHLYRQVWGDDREERARAEAVRRIIGDPVGFGALVVRKTHDMWAGDYYGVRFGLQDAGALETTVAVGRLLSQVFYAAVLVAATGSLWATRRRPPKLVGLIVAIVVITATLHVFVEVQARYHAHVVPLMILLAAWRLAGLSETAIGSDQTTDAVGTSTQPAAQAG